MKSIRNVETQIFNKINPAVQFSVTRYVLAIGVFVALIVFGLICTFSLGVDLLPSVNMPTVSVNTSYQGANPGVIDQQVTQVIEDTLSTLSGIIDMESTSSIGSSRVTVTFDPSADRNAVANQVGALVSGAVRRLPTGVGSPVVQTFDPNSQPILQFGVTGSGASLSSVAEFIQNTLAPAIEHVPGVANITMDGAPTRQFQVLLNPDRLRYYGLSPQQVISAISATSINQPVGTIVHQNTSLTFSTQNTPIGIDAIRAVIVDSARGVFVSDLATVRDASVTSNIARVNGIPAVLVSIQRTSDSNSVQVVDSVKKLVDSANLPAGYAITYSNDTTGPIRASIESTFREMLTTLIIVAIIVLLFTGKLNTALSVIFAIPIALAAAPVLYKLAGFSFNLVSLLALIIAIGIVVDDSIVVAENVERYKNMGFGLKDAVFKGASEVFSAVVAATLSLLSVLVPVSFIGGSIGRYLQQFSLGLAIAVLFSLLEAVLFLTVRLAYTPESEPGSLKEALKSLIRIPDAFKWGFQKFYKPLGIIAVLAAAGLLLWLKQYPYLPLLLAYPVILGLGNYIVVMVLKVVEALTSTLHGLTEKILGKIRDAYADSLGKILKGSAFVLIAAGLFLAATFIIVLPNTPFSFVPQTDAGTLNVSLRFPRGTAIKLINDAAGLAEGFLLKKPEIVSVQTVVGGNAQMLVRLVPNEERASVFSLAPQYRKELAPILKDQPSARISVNTGGGFQGQGNSISLSIVAADFNILLERNAAIIDALQKNPNITDLNSSLSDMNLENEFIPDPSRLKGTGITPAMIAAALQTFTTGTQASNVVTGGLSYPIRVQADPTILSGSQSLLDLPVYSSTLQTSLSVGQLGKFVLNVAPVSLSRYNRQYMGDLNINLKPDAPPPLSMQNMIIADLKSQGLLEGGLNVTASSHFGQTALASQLADAGIPIFALALFLVYLVMAAQFNSWRYPVYLLIPVPLALAGAFWLVFATGGGLDIFGLMGMLMLIGLSAKNAILYLDFVVERIGKMPLADALVEAARLRFRPIIMTTLTVLVISFPLIFGSGQGSEFGKKMGIVMLGGIVLSAILTFFVVPAAFYLMEKKKSDSRGFGQPAGEG